MCKDMVNSCKKTIWMQIACDFRPRAAVEYPYVSVEVGHCVKAESGESGRKHARGVPSKVGQRPSFTSKLVASLARKSTSHGKRLRQGLVHRMWCCV